MSAAVGADVEALCSKCGDVWHVVVAKVGDTIVKVLCKECKKEHRYKSPHGQPKEKRHPTIASRNAEHARTASERAERGPSPTTASAPRERFEKPAVAADLSKPVRKYGASLKYEVTERVEHPIFGQGVVEVSEPGKVTVFFATGRRVLAQAKETGGGGLTRPKPFDHTNTAGGKPVSEG